MVYNDAYTLALKYAFNSGSAWTVAQINNGSGYGQDANLTVDGNGNADIYYYNVYGGDIEHATRNGGVWSNTPITAGGVLLDFAIGAQGQKTLSWINGGGAVVGEL